MNQKQFSIYILCGLFCIGCSKPNTIKPADSPAMEPTPGIARHVPKPSVSPIRFEWMEQTGVDFIYQGGPTSEANMTEQNGGGIALLDYDNDGYLDVFFVDCWPIDAPLQARTDSHRLYRGRGNWKFEDVTQEAGLDHPTFGMGCTAGDYDNDGDTDLFVAGYRDSQLWENTGDGTFRLTSESLGRESKSLWGTSAAFADLNDDGLLDLFVVNYVNWSRETPPCFFDDQKTKRICSPLELPSEPDLLFQNLGDGRFTEVGQMAGVAGGDEGKGLAVEIADFDEDGRLDIYLANDTTPNALFRNRGNMLFEEVGVPWGVAVSSTGVAGASMGIACADYDGNGHLDLFVTNFANQVKDLFSGLGPAGFVSRNSDTGLDLATRSKLSFGTVFADFDRDGWPDLFMANGHIWNAPGETDEYEMPAQIFANQQGRRFVDSSHEAGNYFQQKWLGRAVACGDLDNDGDPDLVVGHLGKPPGFLNNISQPDNSSQTLRVHLIGTRTARQPLGVRVDLVTATGKTTAHVPAGGSFQASHDPVLLLTTRADIHEWKLLVHWSSANQTLHSLQTPDTKKTWTIFESASEQ